MSADYYTFQRTKHFGSLDGLRCISIVGVLATHVELYHPGELGVDLFFVISGFLITTLLLRERDRRGTISLYNFYIRRALRIFPLYYSVLLLYIFIVLMTEMQSQAGRDFIANLPYFLTYTSNWFVELDTHTWQPVFFLFAWSLATEEQFYATWPAIQKRLSAASSVVWSLTIICLIELTKAGAFSAIIPLDSLVHTIVTSVATPIFLGVILANVLHTQLGYDLCRRILGRRSSSVVALGVLIVCLVVEQPAYRFRAMSLGSQLHLLVVYISMTALVASCVMREDHWLAPMLGWRPIFHLGTISYGIYLLNRLCMHAVDRVLTRFGFTGEVILFLGTTLIATVVATLSHRYYEGYFLQFKRRFVR